jgi:hypothetical protein
MWGGIACSTGANPMRLRHRIWTGRAYVDEYREFDATRNRDARQLRDQLWAMLQKMEWLLFASDKWELPPGVDLEEYRRALYPRPSRE